MTDFSPPSTATSGPAPTSIPVIYNYVANLNSCVGGFYFLNPSSCNALASDNKSISYSLGPSEISNILDPILPQLAPALSQLTPDQQYVLLHKAIVQLSKDKQFSSKEDLDIIVKDIVKQIVDALFNPSAQASDVSSMPFGGVLDAQQEVDKLFNTKPLIGPDGIYKPPANASADYSGGECDACFGDPGCICLK